ncbi:CHAT domain-containing protein [Streptomyces sp. NPDC047869]|uniref:CHAT domain-containing protein n=1 Tax=Streptomyces sp. NPDC047869 TaxID=3154709 RepID=UPI0034561140
MNALLLGRRAHARWLEWQRDPGNFALLDEIVELRRATLSAAGAGHPQLPELGIQFGNDLMARWRATGALRDLDEAIGVLEYTARSVPPSDYARWMAGHVALRELYGTRHTVTGHEAEAVQAAGVAREVADRAHVDDPETPAHHEAALRWAVAVGRLRGDAEGLGRVLAEYRLRAEAASQQGGMQAVLAWRLLRLCAEERYEVTNDPADFRLALEAAAQTIAFSTPGTEAWHRAVWWRCGLLFEDYARTHSVQAFDEAARLSSAVIDAWRLAPDRAGGRDAGWLPLALRGRLHCERYAIHGVAEDLHQARADLSEAFAHVDGTNRLTRGDVCYHLGEALLYCYIRDPADARLLGEAGRLAEQALAVVPPEHRDYGLRLLLRSAVRHHEALRTGGIEALGAAVAAYQQAVRALAIACPGALWRAHNQLSIALMQLYQLTGGSDVLHAAVASAEQCLEGCPAGEESFRTANLHTTLGQLLRMRYEEEGSADDLRRALHHTHTAIELVPTEDSPEWAARLSNHAITVSLPDRPEDRRAAERILRSALDAQRIPGSTRALLHHNLGTQLRQTAEATGDRAMLREAIDHLERAVEEALPTDLNQANYRRNLAHALHALWKITREQVLLDRAFDEIQQALATGSESASDRHLVLSSYVSFLTERSTERQSPEDLALALDVGQQALDITPSGHRLRGALLTQYGECLHAWSRFQEDPASALEALDYLRQGLAAYPEDHPTWVDQALFLADALMVEPSESRQMEALELYRKAARHRYGRPGLRWTAALSWGRLLAQAGNWSGALEGYASGVEVLPQLAWAGLSREDRLLALGSTSSAVSDAAAVALNAGSPERAVELLEHGRAQLLSQALDMNSDLDAVRARDARLADELERVRGEVDNGPAADAGRDRAQEASHGWARQRRDLHHRWEELVAQVRLMSGMGRFLLPPLFDELAYAGNHGPVVLLNVSHLRCDALILTGERVDVLPLPSFNVRKAELRADTLARLLMRQEPDAAADVRSYLADLLRWLWHTVSGPVLDFLGLSAPDHADGRSLLPRLWWCPTGVLNRLPVHAAGMLPDDPYVLEETSAPMAMDCAVSSYTPTVRSLISARAWRNPEGARPVLRPLVVDVGHVPQVAGLPDLPHVEKEASLVAGLLPGAVRLQDQAATRFAVLSALTTSGWFHFAGHGKQDSDSADGTLFTCDHAASGSIRVADIAALRLKGAELAYLSACETLRATVDHPDEPVTLAGAMRLAGFRHVVATQWRLDSHRARHTAGTFYRSLLGDPDSAEVAIALHTAVQELRRERPGAPELWAPFVHVGP